MQSQYQDIITLPHPTSAAHPRMSRHNRAAQFAPFAALTGYDAAIQEAGRVTEQEKSLSEDRVALLDQKLQYLEAHPEQHLSVSMTYFLPDHAKSGGAYRHLTGTISIFDRNQHRIVTNDGTSIPIDDITDLELSPCSNSSQSCAFDL